MIRNERQYRISRAQARKFAEALDNFEPAAGSDPRLAQIEKQALRSQLDDLRDEIGAYERTKSSDLNVFHLDVLQAAGEVLTMARTAAGLSQRGLAEEAGIKEQQIQRYEAEDYQSASVRQIDKISRAIKRAFARQHSGADG